MAKAKANNNRNNTCSKKMAKTWTKMSMSNSKLRWLPPLVQRTLEVMQVAARTIMYSHLMKTMTRVNGKMTMVSSRQTLV